jgi:hypothetical protein
MGTWAHLQCSNTWAGWRRMRGAQTGVTTCNFFTLTLLENFFINRPLGKQFSYMYSDKGTSLAGALGGLQGAAMIDALSLHVDKAL